MPTLEGISTRPQLAPIIDWKQMGGSDHFVQFYEEDSFLIESVAGFMSAGLQDGEAAVVIATKAHREALDDCLVKQGVDIHKAHASGQYISLDAADTLLQFMVEDRPDPELFNRVVGNLVLQAGSHGRPIRAFGEMVALLCQSDNSDAAIQLEELWNDLGTRHRFSLFCAYPMGDFCGETHGKPFTHICHAHSRVIPSESYTANYDVDHRLRDIARLQQKAASLEAEIFRRKQIEKELVQQRRELSDFLQQATEGIHQIAPDGKILWANQAELDLLGYKSEEYIGHDIREFHADAPVIADILERLGHGEKLEDYEARLKHKDGSIRHVSINSSVCWEEGRFRYTRCFTRDITERKHAAEVLEQTVAERTAQLRETVGELEAFSYTISHDLRSPLRAIQGNAQILLKDHRESLGPAAVDSLNRIERSAQRLGVLVRELLAYNKVSKGEVELKAVPLGPLLEDLISQQPQLHEARRAIIVEHPLHTVLGNEACLAQCFLNLIENGLKFVNLGSTAEIRIRSELVGDKICVSVKDNGIGISPEHYDRIFQIFGRVYPEKCYPGTGIGLAIVKKAVARMGGEVGFESVPDQGTRFWFTLSQA